MESIGLNGKSVINLCTQLSVGGLMKIASFIVFLAFTAFLFGGAPSVSADESIQLAQNQGLMCFNDCIETNGTDAKGACARQCGLAGGASQPKRDCGTEYKACKKACDKKDKECNKACRTARKSCF